MNWTDREPVTKAFIVGMSDTVQYHLVNTILGAVCTVVNVFLLFIFLVSPSLRRKCEVLIVLCVADGFNCFSIMLMGLNRVLLYTEVIETLSIPIRTQWECAVEPWIIFRGYGDLWPPTVQSLMGVERCVAVFDPIRYNRRSSRRCTGWFLFGTLVLVTLALAVGFVCAWLSRDQKVKYWCGRKAAFGNTYASFIYAANIFGYVIGFLLTVISYFKTKLWLSSSYAKEQLARIKFHMLISVLSIVLISIPNGLSLFAQYIASVADAIAKPSTYLTCVNSAIDIFVYLLLNQEFRSEFRRIILRQKSPVISGPPMTVTMVRTQAPRRSHISHISTVGLI
ncbi:hypothetical protein Q1695_011171 [Nippostrongylus brasiliensis]|nr:hypothetical protein Q1695_011171 [Nippostrongylus brasiliensis]